MWGIMKPHLIVRVRPGVSAPQVPHWSDVLERKDARIERFLPATDAILRGRAVPVWATREYRPAAADGRPWTEQEMASGLDRTFRLILQREQRIPQGLIEAIRLVPEIESVRPGFVAAAPLPRAQAVSRRPDEASRAAIYLPESHRVTRGDRAITVAVLDTGMSSNHRELPNAEAGFDTVHIIDGHDAFVGDLLDADALPEDDVGHGTHVAGIAVGAGRRMPVGVAPLCRLLPVRVLAAMQRDGERYGAGLVDNINQGVKWAVDQGADVINMSLGVRHEGGGLPHEDVIDYARRAGVTVVAAAGNDGREELYYPGALPGVITVGAMAGEGDVAPFSTYGHQVDLIAPGEEIYSSYRDGGYAFATGTSHAAPFVTGAVALLKSFGRAFGRRLTDGQVKHLLKHTADRIDRRFKHPKAGFGRLNIADALRLAEAKLA